MINRVGILTVPDDASIRRINWERLGSVMFELAELYQAVKERRFDVILVHQDHTDLTRGVAQRIRRSNGLTDLWRVVAAEDIDGAAPEHFEGQIAADLGTDGMIKRVKQILGEKDLLAQYGIVARSPSMRAVAQTIERIAPTDVTVLIVGPSGAGKELVARALHDNSKRSDRPFVAINCGALAEGVLESELFGHEKGAFTGSVSKREGLFHKADGGTIFLDEIGETKPDMQVKLLRVLEDGTYYPVGSSTPRRATARVIAATNRDLTEAIADREFREDLYFRVGVVKIVVPPLMDRRSDIQALLQHFLRSKGKVEYTDAALDKLVSYDWPGNVRELRNFASRMAALKPGGLITEEDVDTFLSEQHRTATNLPVRTGRTVEEAGHELIYRAILSMGNEIRMLRDLITAHLPGNAPIEEFDARPMHVQRPSTMEDMERLLIEQVLAETDGNRKETARRLGIGERTLYRKLKKYDLH